MDLNKPIPEPLIPLIDDCWLHYITEHPEYSSRKVEADRLKQDCLVFNFAFVAGWKACVKLDDAFEAEIKKQPAPARMTDDRFNELLNGPLAHPMIMFRLTRLQMALRDVIDRCGSAGIEALERHCREREESDQRKAGD